MFVLMWKNERTHQNFVHIISDIKDHSLDSWVFLESQSFECRKVEWITNFPSMSSGPSMSPSVSAKPTLSHSPTEYPTPPPQNIVFNPPGPSPGGGGGK